MTIAAYTGTFDPITLGHVNVISRTAAMFESVIVAVAESPGKQPLFSLQERLQLAEDCLGHLNNIRITGFSGLVVDFARENSISVLVRGVRSLGDLDYEKQMAVMNRHLAPGVDTVMLAPAPEYAHISSSLVREIALLGGDIRELVSPPVAVALGRKAAR